jgi:hypothetical protein
MIGKWEFVSRAFVVCTLLFSGCNSIKNSLAKIGADKTPRVDELEKTPAEQQKAMPTDCGRRRRTAITPLCVLTPPIERPRQQW